MKKNLQVWNWALIIHSIARYHTTGTPPLTQITLVLRLKVLKQYGINLHPYKEIAKLIVCDLWLDKYLIPQTKRQYLAESALYLLSLHRAANPIFLFRSMIFQTLYFLTTSYIMKQIFGINLKLIWYIKVIPKLQDKFS